jgi:hypothetical protein
MRYVAAALVLALAAGANRRADATSSPVDELARGAFGTVTITGPAGNPLTEATPTLTAQAVGFDPADQPLAITIQVSTTNTFAGALLFDSTVTGASLTVTLPRPLPDKATVYWRARARTVDDIDVFSPVEGPRTAATWLRLLLPNESGGEVLPTRQPRFLWTSARVASPPGPWEYEIRIISVATGAPVIVATLPETTFVPATPLESNSSYRWSVRARLLQGIPEDTIVVASRATFVISAPSRPRVTLLYQNFPNPFPSGDRTSTCIWFDIREFTAVTLEIYDLRGRLVRRLLSGDSEGVLLPSGRYGRAPGGGESGCDPQFTWDGSASDGRRVPAGVYLVRLRAGDFESMKKIVFRGQ